MKIDAARIIERRRAEQRTLLARASELAAGLDPGLGVRAVVVFGSVARGDFNRWSDVDVLVIADHLPDRALDRLDALGPRPPLVQPVAWTAEELRQQLVRFNPIATEALERGVWLVGTPGDVGAG
ncbi:MAG: nucleotidyltransferase domain-containing protein [Acidimicrobiales bacterium]